MRISSRYVSALALVLVACGDAQPENGAEPLGSRTQAASNWQWPFGGADSHDWVINNYVDLDPSSGLLDYRNGNRTYDGHGGIDIDVATFRQMDAGFPVRAVAGGQVIEVVESNPDRNLTCAGDWNRVVVRLPDGYEVIYGHLKRDSVPVSVGQTVVAGATLGVVGSSGCSTQAHLHLETRSPSGVIVDPMQQGFFASPPAYDTPMGFMDVVVADTTMQREDVMAPAPNVSSFLQGSPLSIAVHQGGGDSPETLAVRVYQPNGSLFGEQGKTAGGYQRHWADTWNWTLPANAAIGSWRADVLINGVVVRSQAFQVASGSVYFENFDDGSANGWTTSGGSWAVTSSYYTHLNDTLVYRQSNLTGNARAWGGGTTSNSSVSARIRVLQFNGTNRFVALLGRVQNASNFYQVALRSGNQLELAKVVGGTTTVLATKTYNVVQGETYDVKLEMNGSALKVFVNNTQEFAVSDSSHTSGQAGVATYYGSADFDQVRVASVVNAALPGPATNPSPASGSSVSQPITLSFAAGSGATSHDIYFGSSNPPPFVGNQTNTTYNPGTLTNGATYYWRVDEKNGAGTTQGSVWQFSTTSGSTTLFSENFESGSLSAFSILSGTWSIGTDGTRVLIGTNFGGNARIAAGSNSWTNQLVSARVKPLSFNGSDRFVAVFARLQNAGNYYYATLRSSGKIELKKLVNGSSTTFSSKSFTVSTNTWYPVRLEAVGSSLRLYVNGSLQLSASDSTFASGRMGLGTYYASAEFDDVLVTSQ
ncbi:MAG: peptidoglycan DD-metalloendopeptidase family protein [Myxococcota bacterium]